MVLQDTWTSVKAAREFCDKFQTLRGFRQEMLCRVVSSNDIDVVGGNQVLERETRSRGLMVNEDKTKCMLSTRNQSRHELLDPIFTIGVDANRCLFRLIRLLGSKQLSRQLILPVLLYGSESCNLKSADVKLL
uniref:Uncharacterized protein n=1 Tax=Megaselia scalaris TaxID=36166 RepID=T1GTM4_MEGSC